MKNIDACCLLMEYSLQTVEFRDEIVERTRTYSQRVCKEYLINRQPIGMIVKLASNLILIILLINCSAINAASINAALISQTNNGTVVTDQPYATTVGANILKQNGNAIDAAVAIGYALAVVYPCCGNIGGGGFMLIHLANGKDTVINFREMAPRASKPELYFDKQGKQIQSSTEDYLAVGVPGTVLGLDTALQKYGTFSLQKVMQPAIDLANQGFILNKYDTSILNSKTSEFLTQPNVANVFLKNNKSLVPGDKLIQKNLANTLLLISQQGTSAFYQGKIADEIVKDSQQYGGILTKQDFANYKIEQQQPISCEYRGHHIITIPPPGSGITVCEILNITEGYPLSKLGFHSALGSHFIIEAMRYAYADRNLYLGDPDFVTIPLTKLLSKQYAENIRQQIPAYHAENSQKINFISDHQEKAETTSYVVTDKFGNVVVVTYTLNGFFGAKVIAGDTGFFLNNEMDDFTLNPGTANFYGLIQGKANLIAPYKRPLSSIAPVIIFKNNKFFIALGTPGGSTIPTQMVQAIEDVIDYGMSINAAVSAPRFHMQWLPDLVYYEPFTFSLRNMNKLQQMGYHLQLGSPYHTLYWGSMTAILKKPATEKFIGAIQNP